MKIRRVVFSTALAVSLLINCGFGYVFGTYAKNHGGWAYVRERLHAGPPVSAVHVASTQERREMLRLVPKVPGQILFMGDSLTQSGPWTDFFPGYPVQNRGIGGSTVRDGINLVRDGVLSGKPSKLFLQYGVNDFGAGTSVKGFIVEYTDLLDAIGTESPRTKVYIQSTVPSQWVRGNTAEPALLREANDALAALARERRCQYIDLYSKLATDSEKGLPDNFSVDGVHISPAAYKVWIDTVRPFVEDEKPSGNEHP